MTPAHEGAWGFDDSLSVVGVGTEKGALGHLWSEHNQTGRKGRLMKYRAACHHCELPVPLPLLSCLYLYDLVFSRKGEKVSNQVHNGLCICCKIMEQLRMRSWKRLTLEIEKTTELFQLQSALVDMDVFLYPVYVPFFHQLNSG